MSRAKADSAYAARLGDVVVADMTVMDDDVVIQQVRAASFPVQEELCFADGRIRRFAAAMLGARAGEARDMVLDVSPDSPVKEFRGRRLPVQMHVLKVEPSAKPVTRRRNLI